MENSNIDSEVWFQNQNQNHCLKFHSSCFPPTSQSALYGSSSMSNTEINTVDEDDVCESYKMRETTKKRKLTPIQLCLLEESFEEDKRLEPDRKLWLAEKLGLQPTQVAVWFQNRRARFKTRQLELDCDSLKASYAKLKTDRDILVRQNQALENKVALLKEELKIQEKLETQSMEAEKLGEEGSSMKSDNTQYTEEEEEEEEEGLGSNQYSFPELAALGFYYDPTLSASNLGLVHIEAKKTLNIFMVGNKNLINKILIFLQVKRTLCYSHGVKVLRPFIELDRQYHIFQWLENPKVTVLSIRDGRVMAEHGGITPAPADEEEQVWSWGAGTDGQLGTAKLQDEHLPQLLWLTSLASISMLACGGAHVIALTSGGKVLTWGRGNSGQLGHGDMLDSSLPKPVSFFDDYVVTQASAGWSHSGFVSDSGCLFTCGNGSFGQLGHGDNMSLCSPAKVSYFADKSVKMVACGMRHSLVLFAGNQVCGFGSGKRGQLGFSSDKTKTLINLPCLVSGLEDVEIVRIAANGDHSAAITANGQMFSWGRGFCGSPDVQAPQCLPSSQFFREVALGWSHALLLTVDGEVFKLGNTLNKQSEKQQLQVDPSEPFLEKVPGFDGVKVMQIAAGAEHSAALTENGEVQTCGWGEHGQLGVGNTNDQNNPQLVSLGSIDQRTRDTKVYCGSGFTYVVRRIQKLSSS
ncbi:hypothetical protein HID58_065827 [Brassica napus]|uniref:BnaC05g19660D protein n=4 Tax=Brassica TaxID=3705 RepID=A0A078FP78_BRANA|nr:hypothetical protein HID58_065827 [Brassica napus]CAF1928072.1 unnamed protein product [Brassica napus]CDY14709.1 BnaC05g19660D [Brassica napus]